MKWWDISVKETSSDFRVLRSSIPKSFLKRTPQLIYIQEFLKCDGGIYITKKKNGLGGELIFSTTDKEYKKVLLQLVHEQFNGLKTFDRKDGFGISNLSLSLAIANKFFVPIGKKTEMEITQPENKEEAKMILRAVIDTEGNVDVYNGRIVIGNKSRKYLNSFKGLLKKWFNINCSDLSPTKGWGEETNRIGIHRDNDLQKINEIILFNPTKQRQLEFICSSLVTYKNRKEEMKRKILSLLDKPKIHEISSSLGIAPFIVRRLLTSLKAKKVGRIKKNNRIQVLWMI